MLRITTFSLLAALLSTGCPESDEYLGVDTAMLEGAAAPTQFDAWVATNAELFDDDFYTCVERLRMGFIRDATEFYDDCIVRVDPEAAAAGVCEDEDSWTRVQMMDDLEVTTGGRAAWGTTQTGFALSEAERYYDTDYGAGEWERLTRDGWDHGIFACEL